MVPDVEDVGPEFHLPPFSKPRLFGESHVLIIDSRPATNRARSVADRSQGNRSVCEQIRIEGVAGNRLASGSSWIDRLGKRASECGADRAARVDFLEGAGAVW